MPEGPKVNRMKETEMNITSTRRRFIEIAPTVCVALFAACSAVIESTYVATAPVTILRFESNEVQGCSGTTKTLEKTQ